MPKQPNSNVYHYVSVNEVTSVGFVDLFVLIFIRHPMSLFRIRMVIIYCVSIRAMTNNKTTIL